jgi:hypothetical protein
MCPTMSPRHYAGANLRLVAYESVAESKKLWIHGWDFSITNLVMDTELVKESAGSSVASFSVAAAGLSPLSLACDG